MPNPLRLLTVPELRKLPPTEVLEGTRFVARGLNIVFGPSGSFKSFYALDASLTVAQSRPVVYVAAEGVGGLCRRIDAWCEHYQQPSGSIYLLCQEINLLNTDTIKELIKLLSDIKPAVVVFDTLSRCIPGADENSAKEMSTVIRNASIIQQALGTTIILIHHTNRAERGERGSGTLRGAADAMIELAANGDGVIRVSCSKLKDDEPWLTEELRFQPVGDSGVLLSSASADPSKLSAQEWQILEFLALDVFETSGAKAIQIVNGINIPERNIYRTLSHLKRELHIQHDSKGDPYRLTDRGKSLVLQRTGKSARILELVVEA